MSTIVTENLKRSSETASRSLRGVAAAWVNFDGTGTIAVRDSQNVSSTTDNGTGDYTVNLSSQMADVNYAHGGGSGGQNGTSNGAVYPYDQNTSRTVSLFRVACFVPAGTLVDTPYVQTVVHGDLA